jgi:hypothetical protein
VTRGLHRATTSETFEGDAASATGKMTGGAFFTGVSRGLFID